MKIGRRISKKAVIIGVAVIVVLLIGIVVAVAMRSMQETSKDSTSEGGNITLENVSKGMTLKSGAPINGTFKPQEGASLYYIVSSEKKVLGTGSITPDNDNKFSRNLAFDTKDFEGKNGELQVYLQDTSGRRLEGVITEVKFE